MLNGGSDCCADYPLFCPVCKPAPSRKDCKSACTAKNDVNKPSISWTGKLKMAKGCIKCKCKKKKTVALV